MSGTVLIVDDERTLARAVKAFLLESGYEAEVAPDAEHALGLLESLRPDVVFSAEDVVFGPELRSLAAAGELRLVEQHTDSAGMLEAAAIETLVPDLAERTTWACGPVGMLEALVRYLAEQSMIKQRIPLEELFVPV